MEPGYLPDPRLAWYLADPLTGLVAVRDHSDFTKGLMALVGPDGSITTTRAETCGIEAFATDPTGQASLNCGEAIGRAVLSRTDRSGWALLQKGYRVPSHAEPHGPPSLALVGDMLLMAYEKPRSRTATRPDGEWSLVRVLGSGETADLPLAGPTVLAPAAGGGRALFASQAGAVFAVGMLRVHDLNCLTETELPTAGPAGGDPPGPPMVQYGSPAPGEEVWWVTAPGAAHLLSAELESIYARAEPGVEAWPNSAAWAVVTGPVGASLVDPDGVTVWSRMDGAAVAGASDSDGGLALILFRGPGEREYRLELVDEAGQKISQVKLVTRGDVPPTAAFTSGRTAVVVWEPADPSGEDDQALIANYLWLNLKAGEGDPRAVESYHGLFQEPPAGFRATVLAGGSYLLLEAGDHTEIVFYDLGSE